MSNKNKKPRGGLLNKGILWFFVIAVIMAVGFSATAFQGLFNEKNALAGEPMFEVQPGPLRISVVESGTIRPKDQLILKSQIEGRTTILYLVPEGKEVKKGEVLVELDASSLEDQLINQEISVQNAEAAYIGARENFEIVKNQTQSDIDVAELDYEFAQLDLEKYLEGEYPNELKKLNTNITLAEEELTRAQDQYKWSQTLYKEKYISETELKSDELAAKKANLNLQIARQDLQLLEDYTKKRQVAQLVSDVTQTKMALERTYRKASAEVAQASAELQAKLAEYDRQKDKLAKLERQIANAVIKAPMDGTVIYATSVRMSFRGNEEPLDEGQEVRERQELIYLPTTDAYMAEVKVHESNLKKISVGMPVRITVEALPGKVFTGSVEQIAPLPDAQSIFMNPDLKLYRTEISVDADGDSGLRNGNTCRAEIMIEEYNDATYVPVHAVVRRDGLPMVYVANGNEWEPRRVELGLDNNVMVRIVSGLKPGEKVWLAPPLASEQLAYAGPGSTGTETVGSAGTDAKASGGQESGSPSGASQGGEPSQPGDQQRQRPDGAFGPPGESGGPPSGGPRGGRGGGRGGGSFGSGGGPGAFGPDGSQGGGQRRGPGDFTPEQREEMRRRIENMSDEERQAMRRRFENMSDEDRQAMRNRRQRNSQSSGRGGPPQEE